MAKKLSPTMIAALEMANAHGGELVCWPGGFWTYPGCPIKSEPKLFQPYRVPEWYVGTGTLHALRERGFTEVSKRTASGFPIGVRIIKSAE